MNEQETLKNIENKLSAILMVLLEFRDKNLEGVDSEKSRKVEVLLADAGFAGPEIAKIINKSLPAVQKAIQRGRK